jgi:hypothetical protein
MTTDRPDRTGPAYELDSSTIEELAAIAGVAGADGKAQLARAVSQVRATFSKAILETKVQDQSNPVLENDEGIAKFKTFLDIGERLGRRIALNRIGRARKSLTSKAPFTPRIFFLNSWC